MHPSRLIRVAAACVLSISGIAFSAASSLAQSTATPQARITAAIDSSSRTALAGSRSSQAIAANDVGAVPVSTKLTGMTLVFSRTPAQQADLDTLVAAQQNPSSPLYHQWLTPAQFGARFGVAASDIAATEAWLQQQGFTIDSVANSLDRIRFSGTAALVASAFGAPLHYFKSGTETHFAPANDLTVPTALASSVLAITNLSDYRPHSHVKLRGSQPNLTSGQTGNYFMSPLDVATIYDINAAYSAGYTGANQTIVIVGQSAVNASDITAFQSAIGLPAKVPTMVLMPGTGASAFSPGDESESDIDLEYSSSIAKGANIYFVYTGNGTNVGVFDALQYAIDNDLAPILSASYGGCETSLDTGSYNSLNGILSQAATQGQTFIVSAGDSGSTVCYANGDNSLTTAQQEALAVDFPASSQYATALGGTEFPTADLTSTYWKSANGSDVIGSALSYIPEEVWNDDLAAIQSTQSLSSGGGGTSTYTPRPSWQASFPGIPSGSFRLVPDISLDSSNYNAPYVLCSSDTTAWASEQDSSCTAGLRDSSSQDFTLAGGTSFAAPIFAGMVAIINQAKGYSSGQSVIAPELYALASNANTYSLDFHDVTSGTNACNAGSAYCGTGPGTTEYTATTGYDEASGLGSVDLYNLLNSWPASTSTLLATTTAVSPATLSPSAGGNDIITITVSSCSSCSPTPTGTVAISDNGTAVSGSPFTLSNGAYSYTYSSTATGTHTIIATYSGDSIYAASTGVTSLNVGNSSFTLSAPNLTVTAGSNGTTTLTLTPVNGYTGTVDFSVNIPSNLTPFCVTGTGLTVSGTAPVTETLTFYTSSSTIAACEAQASSRSGANGHFAVSHSTNLSSNHGAPPANSPWKSAPLPAAFAGLLIAGCFKRRSRLLRGSLALGALVLLSLSGLGLMGCGSSGSTAVGPSVNAPKGTYTLTLTGTDSANSALTSSVNFTVTIQ